MPRKCRCAAAIAVLSVFEGTAPGIRGSRATSYTARIIEHKTIGQDRYYIVAPTAESRQTPRKVREYAVQEQKSFMSDTNQRKRGQMSSQQRKEKNKDRHDIALLERELSKARKNTEKLQQKHNMTLKENKTMKEERAALLSLVVGGKSRQQKRPAKVIERLLEPIIKVARDRLIMDYEALEKKAQRLERQVSYREKESDFLRSRLSLRLMAEKNCEVEKTKH